MNNLPNSVVPGISLSRSDRDPCGQNGNTGAEITPTLTLAINYSAVCEYGKKIIRLLDTRLGGVR